MGTLNPDPNLRMKAELRIGEILPHPGFFISSGFVRRISDAILDAGTALASILASSDVDISMRQICLSCCDTLSRLICG
jgi:hypothetical protein